MPDVNGGMPSVDDVCNSLSVSARAESGSPPVGRPDTDEGIPRPDALLGRLEEVCARQVRRQLGVETDGTFTVSEKAAKHRNNSAFDGELAEPLQGGGEIADHVWRSGPLSRRASKQVRSPV